MDSITVPNLRVKRQPQIQEIRKGWRRGNRYKKSGAKTAISPLEVIEISSLSTWTQKIVESCE